MLDGLYDAFEVRVAGKDNKCCAGLAVDAGLVVEDAGREDVSRALVAELIRDVLQRSSLAIFLMREAEDVMQTVHGRALSILRSAMRSKRGRRRPYLNNKYERLLKLS